MIQRLYEIFRTTRSIDSTFISPKYVQTIESKPISEWIIAVGRQEGFGRQYQAVYINCTP